MILRKYVELQVFVRSFFKDRDGVTAIEYALVGVAIAAIVAAVFTGNNNPLQAALEDGIETIADNLD
ncbi:Flp family type IVb pilin [Vibrio sp. LaRot3]|uniref:Flp family type IVb pilin n=1 Tax=Vibrio sp. LaRot3 TaxID=2998829 RepID=UPI0022CDF8A9|nr:Flp family type IVb pilin [Vibrio sp. LaRot3]MDA0148794.1 Flp family type IVb pilin [Vibrio sp. LaRot3]